jgi:toxin ParE1/3/4
VAFLAELDVAMLQIQEAPLRWPLFHQGYRRFVLHKFPFSVVYATRAELIEVIAIAHHRRRPGYWASR